MRRNGRARCVVVIAVKLGRRIIAMPEIKPVERVQQVRGGGRVSLRRKCAKLSRDNFIDRDEAASFDDENPHYRQQKNRRHDGDGLRAERGEQNDAGLAEIERDAGNYLQPSPIAPCHRRSYHAAWQWVRFEINGPPGCSRTWKRGSAEDYACISGGSGRTGPIASTSCAVVAYQSSMQRSRPVPLGLAFHHMYRSEFDLALRVAEDLLRGSRQRGDSGGVVLGHNASGAILIFPGRFGLSRSHLEEVLRRYDPIRHRPLVHQAVLHIHVPSQAFLGIVLFCLGYPDQALVHSNSAITEARRLAHPPSLAGGLAAATRLLSLMGDDAALKQRTDELVAVTTEQGFPFWGAMGTICHGWIKVRNGDVVQGISLLRSGSIAYRATGVSAWTPYHIALQARAYEIAGH
jgi:hypothetical protein